MKALSIQVAVVLLAFAAQAGAQAPRPARVGEVPPLRNFQPASVVQPYTYYLPSPNYYRYRAATVGESYARGLAAVTYAQGQYNWLRAGARVFHANAYEHEVSNYDLTVRTYFATRQYNREAVAAERGPRATLADLERFAAQEKPKRLSPSELQNTGQISWPLLLQTDEFAPFRAEMENAFAKRAANGSIGLDDHSKVSQTTQVMLDVLQEYVHAVPPMDYTAAKRFIESLGHEARQPLG